MPAPWRRSSGSARAARPAALPHDYSDVAVLGKAFTRGPGWIPCRICDPRAERRDLRLVFYERLVACPEIPVGSRSNWRFSSTWPSSDRAPRRPLPPGSRRAGCRGPVQPPGVRAGPSPARPVRQAPRSVGQLRWGRSQSRRRMTQRRSSRPSVAFDWEAPTSSPRVGGSSTTRSERTQESVTASRRIRADLPPSQALGAQDCSARPREAGFQESGISSVSPTGSPSKRSTASRFRACPSRARRVRPGRAAAPRRAHAGRRSSGRRAPRRGRARRRGGRPGPRDPGGLSSAGFGQGKRGAVGLRRVGGCDYERLRLLAFLRAELPKPLDGAAEGELRAAQPLDEVAAPAEAECLESLELPVDGAVAARDPLGADAVPRDDSLALEQKLGERAPVRGFPGRACR